MGAVEAKVAKKAVPRVMNKLGVLANIDLSTAIRPAIEAISKYSLRNQIAVTEAIKAVCPAFMAVSEKFFTYMEATIRLSEETSCRKIEHIVDKVFEDNSPNFEVKIANIKEILQMEEETKRERSQQTKEAFRHAVSVLGIVVFGVASMNSKTSQSMVKEHGKTQRVKIKQTNLTKRTKIRKK